MSTIPSVKVAIPSVAGAEPAPSSAMSRMRVLRAYWIEAKYEFLHMLRAPVFVIPFLVLPPAIYLFFGVLIAGQQTHANPAIGTFLLTGFSVFALVGPTLFGVGCSLAIERDAGLLKLKRAQPAPTGAYLIAKTGMAMVFAALAMASILVAALYVGKIGLSGGRVLALSAVLVVGSIPFCAIGLAIGAHVRGSAAPGVAHLLYLPMLYLSGLFFPLPPTLSRWAIVWPAFHLDRLALAVAAVPTPATVAPAVSIAYLAAISVVCGAVAIRRLARVG